MSTPTDARMTAADRIVQLLKFMRSDSFASSLEPALHPAQLGDRRQLSFVDPLDAVAQRLLDVADVRHQAQETADLDRRRLVASPQRPVEGDVALDERGAQRHRRPGRRETGLV